MSMRTLPLHIMPDLKRRYHGYLRGLFRLSAE